MASRTVRPSTAASDRSASPAASCPTRRPVRILGVAAAALLSFATAACGDDDDNDTDIDDSVDQTEVTSASGSAVPGQPPEPVNTDPVNSQVTPTIAP
jgi:hypothetical protein